MIKEQFLDQLQRFDKFGSGTCLERVAAALEQLKLKRYLASATITVITGTNGKGSTAYKLTSLLTATDHDTALFTSPHFVEFNERFKHQGNNIPYTTLNQQLQHITPVITQISQQLNQQFGIFEVLFLLATYTFAQRKIPYLVIEAGIGGRYDPSRLLAAPLCALTSLDLEHTHLLGNTLEDIACDKLDATAPNGHCILGQLIYPPNPQRLQRLMTTLQQHAKARDITLSLAAQQAKVEYKDTKLHITLQQQHSFTLSSPPQSPADLINWQHALALFDHLTAGKTLTDKQLTQAFTTGQAPGRLETVAQNPHIIIDAAHTNAAYQWLFDTIKTHYNDKARIFVVGLSQGRDIAQFKQQIAPLKGTLIATQAFKGIDCATLKTQLNCQYAFADIGQAITYAIALAIQQQARIFIVGGLFLGASASAYIRQLPYDNIHLF